MLVKIRCCECNREGSFYFAGSSYQSTYTCSRCGCRLTVTIEDGQIKSCEPLELIRREVNEIPSRRDNWSSVTTVLMIVGIAPLVVFGVSLFLVQGTVLAYIGAFCGFVMLFISGMWIIIIAFSESTKCGLLCLFLPFYILYYVFTRQTYTQWPFLIGVLGFCLFLFVLVMGIFSPPWVW